MHNLFSLKPQESAIGERSGVAKDQAWPKIRRFRKEGRHVLVVDLSEKTRDGMEVFLSETCRDCKSVRHRRYIEFYNLLIEQGQLNSQFKRKTAMGLLGAIASGDDAAHELRMGGIDSVGGRLNAIRKGFNCSNCGSGNISYDVRFGTQSVSTSTQASTLDKSKAENSPLDILRRRFALGARAHLVSLDCPVSSDVVAHEP